MAALRLERWKSNSNQLPALKDRRKEAVTRLHSRLRKIPTWQEYQESTRQINPHQFDVLNQYNNIVDNNSLTFKTLPPIKLSIKSNGRSDSPLAKGGTSIIKPVYSVKTMKQGHNVFTEGISTISTSPDPTLTMKHVGVPYSNLPRNLKVCKERSRISFGIVGSSFPDSEYMTTNALSSKPFGLESTNLIRTIDLGRNLKSGSTLRRPKMPPLSRTYASIKLDPIAPKNEEDGGSPEEDIHLGSAGIHQPTNSALAEGKTSKNSGGSDRVESRVSVVSIGNSVTPNHFEKPKRYIKKLYPIYDWKTNQQDLLKRAKFGIGVSPLTTHRSLKEENAEPSPIHMSRVNTQLFGPPTTDRRNTLDEKNVIGSQDSPFKKRSKSFIFMGLPPGLKLINANSPLESLPPERRLQVQTKQLVKTPVPVVRPASSDSGGTHNSPLIPNPPPSEISQSYLDDTGNTAEMHRPMIPLKEERVMSEKGQRPLAHATPEDALTPETFTNTPVTNEENGNEDGKNQTTTQLLSVPRVSMVRDNVSIQDLILPKPSVNEISNSISRIMQTAKIDDRTASDLEKAYLPADFVDRAKQGPLPVKTLKLILDSESASPNEVVLDQSSRKRTEDRVIDDTCKLKKTLSQSPENEDKKFMSSKTILFMSPAHVERNAKRQ